MNWTAFYAAATACVWLTWYGTLFVRPEVPALITWALWCLCMVMACLLAGRFPKS